MPDLTELCYLKKRLRNDMQISKVAIKLTSVKQISPWSMEEDEDTDCETLDEYIAENGEEIGFPKY